MIYYYIKIENGLVTAWSRLSGPIDAPDWHQVSEGVFLGVEERGNNGDYTAPDLTEEGA